MKVNRKIAVITALVLVALAAFGLGACKGNKAPAKDDKAPATNEAYTLYKTAFEKFQSAEGITMGLNTNISDGQDFTIDMKGTVAFNRLSSDKTELKMDEKINLLGTAVDTVAYYKDGFLYADAAGQKIKQALSESDILPQTKPAGELLPESVVKDAKVKDVAAGREISFAVDGKAFENLLKEPLEIVKLSNSDVTFKDAKVVVVVSKDGDLISQSVTFDFSVKVEKNAIDAKMTMNMRDIKFGKVTIDFPKDLDSYKETKV
ncbi:MAG: hypothetical protein LBL36_03735 [Clostridiales Family XIII bacterium]|jgi:hypothetical protein|nr:hypothetical protein [Clostridiales Family XIII bacterium]